MARNITAADFGVWDRSFSARAGDHLSPRGIQYGLFPVPNGDHWFDFSDFTGKALDTTNDWSVGKDTNATNFVKSTGANGRIAGTAGTTNGEGIALYRVAEYYGDNNVGMEVRMQLSYVTNAQVEIGFFDVRTNAYDPCVTDIDTPTIANGAVDTAALAWDTAQTLTKFALVTKGSTPYTATTTTLKNGGGATANFAPTASTFYRYRVQLIGDNVYSAIYSSAGGLLAFGSKSLGVEGGTALLPVVMVSRASTSDIVATVDYVALWGDRA